MRKTARQTRLKEGPKRFRGGLNIGRNIRCGDHTYLRLPDGAGRLARSSGGDLGEIRFIYVEYLLEWLAPTNTTKLCTKGGHLAHRPGKAGPRALGNVGHARLPKSSVSIRKRCLSANRRLSQLVPNPRTVSDDPTSFNSSFEDGSRVCVVQVGCARSPELDYDLRSLEQRIARMAQECSRYAPALRLGNDIVYRRCHPTTGAGNSNQVSPPGNPCPEGYVEPSQCAIWTCEENFSQVGATMRGKRLSDPRTWLSGCSRWSHSRPSSRRIRPSRRWVFPFPEFDEYCHSEVNHQVVLRERWISADPVRSSSAPHACGASRPACPQAAVSRWLSGCPRPLAAYEEIDRRPAKGFHTSPNRRPGVGHHRVVQP